MAKNSLFCIQNIIKPFFQGSFDQKQMNKKMAFFEKCDFWDFKILTFLWPKIACFVSRTLLNLFSSLILTEKK